MRVINPNERKAKGEVAFARRLSDGVVTYALTGVHDAAQWIWWSMRNNLGRPDMIIDVARNRTADWEVDQLEGRGWAEEEPEDPQNTPDPDEWYECRRDAQEEF